MLEQLDALKNEAQERLATLDASADLEAWYRDLLGKKGQVYLMTRQIGSLSNEERPLAGKRINEVKKELQAAYDVRAAAIKEASTTFRLQTYLFSSCLKGKLASMMTP